MLYDFIFSIRLIVAAETQRRVFTDKASLDQPFFRLEVSILRPILIFSHLDGLYIKIY